MRLLAGGTFLAEALDILGGCPADVDFVEVRRRTFVVLDVDVVLDEILRMWAEALQRDRGLGVFSGQEVHEFAHQHA